jgi:hypothetical protein
MDSPIKGKLERLVELEGQQLDLEMSGQQRTQTSDEFVALSKEVASHYRPLVEKLVEAGIIMINTIPNCAVFQADVVMKLHKSYFNEGKILLFGDADEAVNTGENAKLHPKFKGKYGKFVARQIPWSQTMQY